MHVTLFFELDESVSFRLSILEIFDHSDLEILDQRTKKIIEVTDFMRPYSSNSRLSLDSLVSNFILKRFGQKL